MLTHMHCDVQHPHGAVIVYKTSWVPRAEKHFYSPGKCQITARPCDQYVLMTPLYEKQFQYLAFQNKWRPLVRHTACCLPVFTGLFLCKSQEINDNLMSLALLQIPYSSIMVWSTRFEVHSIVNTFWRQVWPSGCVKVLSPSKSRRWWSICEDS